MPYSFETHHLHIPRHLDRRVHISDSLRERIRFLYFTGGMAQRAIARECGVSRSMVAFLLFPERLLRARALFKERRKDGRYYSKNKNRLSKRKHRVYKYSIKKLLI